MKRRPFPEDEVPVPTASVVPRPDGQVDVILPSGKSFTTSPKRAKEFLNQSSPRSFCGYIRGMANPGNGSWTTSRE